MGEYIDHHDKKEQTEMFPKMCNTKRGLVAIQS